MKRLLPEEYRAKIIASIIVVAAGVGIFMVSQRLGAIAGFIKMLISALQPVLVGIAIAYLLSPLLARVETGLGKLLGKNKPRKKLCRTLGVLICFALFVAVLAAFLGIILPQVYYSIKSVITLLIGFLNTNGEKLSELLQKVGIIAIDGDDFVIAWEGLINQGVSYVSALFSNALAITQDLYSLILNLLVALAVSVYSLFEKERFGSQVKKVLYSVFSEDACASIVYWMSRSNRIFSGFISGKIYDSMLMGVLCYVCMRIFKMDYPELVSCIFGVTNVVPFFGPIVGGVIGTLLLLIVNPSTAIWFALLALVLQQLDGNVIGPHILGETIGLSAFWIMLAILVGGGIFGFMGMLLGAPVFAIIYALVKALVEYRLRQRGLPIESEAYLKAPISVNKENKND